MRYEAYLYEENDLKPLVPFMFEGEICADFINQAIKEEYDKLRILPPGMNVMPKSAENVLLLEYADYGTYKPQAIPDISQYAGGYTGCVAAFRVENGHLIDARKPTEMEIEACDKYHRWCFVSKSKSRKKKTDK